MNMNTEHLILARMGEGPWAGRWSPVEGRRQSAPSDFESPLLQLLAHRLERRERRRLAHERLYAVFNHFGARFGRLPRGPCACGPLQAPAGREHLPLERAIDAPAQGVRGSIGFVVLRLRMT